jgi:mevalonate kinase
MIRREFFSAKLMLFGEYSILLGSPALSIPFNSYHASLKRIKGESGPETDRAHHSNNILRALCEHYRSLPELSDVLDLENFTSDLKYGLYLDSSIPERYGVGSSGALCAALYSRYAFDPPDPDEPFKNDLSQLRTIFISMESYFHGTSSGFDPMVSYLGKPLKINRDGRLEMLILSSGFLNDDAGAFLLDTGQSSGTAPLVHIFMDQYNPGGTISREGKEFCKLTGLCISSMTVNDPGSFRDNMKALSAFQLNGLSPMIPGHVRGVWKDTLEEGIAYFKLCGSGGGGFLTGFAPDLERARIYLLENHYRIVQVQINNHSSTKNQTYHAKNMDQSAESDPPYL